MMIKENLNVVGAKRLLKLAKFLHALPKEKFDYSTFVNESGTPMLEALKLGKHACKSVACAIGWTPAVFPKLVEWSRTSYGAGVPQSKSTGNRGFWGGAELFRLSLNATQFLFDPGWSMVDELANPLPSNATPKQVARHIRRFVKANYAGKANLDYGN